LGENPFAGSIADVRRKEKAWGGVLAQQESTESGVDTSAYHRGVRHDSTDEQRRGGKHGCGDHGHAAPGIGNQPLATAPVWVGVGYMHRENKRKGKEKRMEWSGPGKRK
jgi:hypothetical protein